MVEGKKNNVIALFKDKPDETLRKVPSQRISGQGNIQVGGSIQVMGNIEIVTPHPPALPSAKIVPIPCKCEGCATMRDLMKPETNPQEVSVRACLMLALFLTAAAVAWLVSIAIPALAGHAYLAIALLLLASVVPIRHI